ncbi:hypothetical protein [Arthrobacter dokdonensis]|uniref:hypothetical protein n=1 Tax=Arthrobacter dokdonellae TaxID=2211210 RepID=UPI000DE5A04E|nr:hypothetical protein [Arthrobacter dokdonellae]
MRTLNYLPDLALALVAVSAVPLAVTGPVPLRALVLGALVLCGPGGAAALWFRRISPNRRSRLAMGTALHVALAIALSLAASLLVATGMVYFHLWNPSAGMWVVAGLTLALLAAQRLPRITMEQFLYGQNGSKTVSHAGH